MSGNVMRVVNAPLGQRFGNNNGQGPHPGADYPAGYGTPAYAPFDCIVRYAGSATGFGDNVVVMYSYAFNRTVLIGHMQAHYVGNGNMLKMGTQIGQVGSQGWSTGPHGHVELRVGDVEWGTFYNSLDIDSWYYATGAYNLAPQWQNPLQITAAQRGQIGSLQKILDVKVDGAWGQATDAALEKIRFFDLIRPNWPAQKPNAQVAALQKLWGLSADGLWGAATDKQYSLWRYCFLNK